MSSGYPEANGPEPDDHAISRGVRLTAPPPDLEATLSGSGPLDRMGFVPDPEYNALLDLLVAHHCHVDPSLRSA